VGGANQTTSGTYIDVYMTAAGCDSTVITNLTVAPNKETTLFEEICDGESFFVGGANQTTSGTYIDIYIAANGCDSTVTTNLTVKPNIETNITQDICEGETFFVGGSFQTNSGTYTDVYIAANGCDSTVYTQLIVNPNVLTVLNETICEGDCFFVDNNPFCTTGTHEVTLTSHLNCDSTVLLNLTVVNPQAEIAEPLLITCDNPSITLDGSNSDAGPGITYLWTASDLDCFEGDYTASTVEVSCPDIYTLLVFQDIGGQQCIGMDEVVVQEYTFPPNVVIDPPGELNCSDPCTTINASQSDNGPPFVPTWTNQNGVVSNELNPTVCQPGTYTLTIVNEDNGCSAAASVDIEIDGTASFADAGPDGILNCINTSVTLDGSNTSVGPGYVLEWTDIDNNFLSNNPIITVNNPGEYILSVFNQNNGCSSADTVTVSVDTVVPEANILGTTILDCATTAITLDGINSLPDSDYSFSWQAPLGSEIMTTDTFDVTAPGTYFLVVNNTNNGCADTTSTVITQNIIAPVADPGQDMSIDCSVSAVNFDGSGSTGNGPLAYLWLNESNATIGSSVTQEANTPGTYWLIVTDIENSCLDTASVVLSSSSVYPIAEAGMDTLINCTNPMISLSSAGSDSGPEYTYEWQGVNGNPIGMDSTVAVGNTGTYTLLVTNTDNGCTSSDVVNVTDDFTAPSADAGPDQILDCLSNSVILDASNSQQGPNISYTWEDSNNNEIGTGTNIIVNAADTYTLVVTDASNGCSATDIMEVTQQIDAPVADAGSDMELNCLVTEVTLDGSNSTFGPNIIVEWTNTVGDSIGDSAQLLTSLPGTYSLNLLDTSNGCTSVSNVVVTIDTLAPELPLLDDVVLNCYSPTATIGESLATENPSWNFAWLDQDANYIDNTDTLTVFVEGTYSLNVRDGDNFCSDQIFVEVTEDFTIPLADAGMDATLDCITASITLDGSNSDQGPDITYEWLDGANMVISDAITLEINTPDTYTLIVTNNENGCSDGAMVAIDQAMDAPTADAGPDLIINCNDTSVMLDGSNSSSGPNISATWTDVDGNFVSDVLQVQVSTPGPYTLNITDSSNGCISVAQAEVAMDTLSPALDPIADIVLNCYEPTNILDSQLSGVNSGWTFNWADDQGNSLAITDTLAVTIAGNYTLTVFDTNNFCESQVSATVTEDFTAPAADAGNDSTLTCTTTSIVLDGSNSDTGPGYLLEWQNSMNELLQEGTTHVVSQADTYTLNITNLNNGCTSADQVNITQDTIYPVVDAGIGETLTCTVLDYDLDGSSSTFGNTPAISWLDQNGEEIGNELLQNVTEPGIYTLNITNLENGCEDSSTVTIVQNITPPTADAGTDFELNCYAPTGSLDGSNSSNGNNFTLEWLDEAMIPLGNTNTLMVSTAQNYTLIVTDTENGCTASDQVTVSEDFVAPVADAGADVTLDCETTQIDLGGTGTSTGNDFVYEWFDTGENSIGNTIDLNVNEGGTYTLTVFNNDNGCSDTSAVVVMVDQEYPEITGTVNDTLTCIQQTATLDASGSSSGNDYGYDWSTISGGVISPGPEELTPFVSNPGIYQLVITNNNNGCAVSTEFTVLQDITPPVANAGQGFELNCHAPISNLNGSLSSPIGLLEYNWGTSNGQFESATDIPQPTISFPGDYLLTVINTQNGCTDSDQVTITSNFITDMEVEVQHPLCHEETGNLVIPAVSGGVPPFLYSIDGGETFGQNTVFTNLVAGQYEIVVMDANDCLFETTDQVIAPDELILTLDTDVTILLGENYQLFALTNLSTSQIDTVIWTPSQDLNCTGCLDPVASPLASTQYAVEVIDTNGCHAIASQNIIVDKQSNVFIPNVFSPNGDGNNDIFTIFSDLKSIERVRSFQIYNRWGEVVFQAFDFQTNDPTYGWDGFFRDKLMNPAVFVYYAEIEYIDGRVELFKGDVTLVR
jgi:gliding motility-associated-like protein